MCLLFTQPICIFLNYLPTYLLALKKHVAAFGLQSVQMLQIKANSYILFLPGTLRSRVFPLLLLEGTLLPVCVSIYRGSGRLGISNALPYKRAPCCSPLLLPLVDSVIRHLKLPPL